VVEEREYDSCVTAYTHLECHYSAWIVGNTKVDTFLRLLRFLRSRVGGCVDVLL
jgi:hypothetical protein